MRTTQLQDSLDRSPRNSEHSQESFSVNISGAIRSTVVALLRILPKKLLRDP